MFFLQFFRNFTEKLFPKKLWMPTFEKRECLLSAGCLDIIIVITIIAFLI